MHGSTYGWPCCALLSVEERPHWMICVSLSETLILSWRKRRADRAIPISRSPFITSFLSRQWRKSCFMHVQQTLYGQLAAKHRTTQHCCPLNGLPQWEILMVSWSSLPLVWHVVTLNWACACWDDMRLPKMWESSGSNYMLQLKRPGHHVWPHDPCSLGRTRGMGWWLCNDTLGKNYDGDGGACVS